MQLKTIFTTILIIAAHFLAPSSARANCYDTYTNAAASCATAQAIRDQIIWTWLDSNNSNALVTLNSELYIDLNYYNLQVANAYGKDGTLVCSGQYYDKVATITATKDQSTSVCNSNFLNNSSNPSAPGIFYLCFRDAEIQYDYDMGIAGTIYNYSVTITNIQLTWDLSRASASKSYSDSAAYHDYNWTMGYDYAKTDGAYYLSDQYYAPLCYSAAGNAYNNCNLDADCNQTPANCCSDGCNKTYNNSVQNASVASLNSTGPAIATYIYQVEMCSVNQQASDSTAQYHAQLTVDNASADCARDVSTASGLYNKTIGLDAVDATFNIAECDKFAYFTNNYTSPPPNPPVTIDSCITTTVSLQTNLDAIALATYQGLVGVNGNPGSIQPPYNTTISNALVAAQTTYQADYQTLTNCVAGQTSTLNSVTDSASIAYNNASNTAWQAYLSCLQGCNGG